MFQLRISLRLAVRYIATALALTGSIGSGRAADPNARLGDTQWRLVTVDSKPALDDTASITQGPHLVFSTASQHLSGSSGCNLLRGRYVQRGTQLALTAQAVTRKACPSEGMRREQVLLQALSATDSYRIEGSTLSLMQGEAVRLTFVDAKTLKKPKRARV